jgi:hypothetical protein
MSTQINLADNKGRNAEVIFKSFTKKPFVKTVTPKGEATQTVRVLKSVAQNSYENLLKANESDEAVAQLLITADPEFDNLMTGLFVEETRTYSKRNHCKYSSRTSHKTSREIIAENRSV